MRMVRGRMTAGGRVAYFGYGSPRARRAPRTRRPRPAPGPDPAADPFTWEDPVRPPQRTAPRPDDIEGTAHEIRDEDELPPGREPFGG